MLNVHVLGSGSGNPSARRDTTSLLVDADGDRTLVDCPGSLVHRLARLGLSPIDLDRLILTHDHVDHVYGIPHLVHACAIAGAPEALVVHAPDDTLRAVARILAAHGLEGEGYPRVEGRPIEAVTGVEVSSGPSVRITASPTAHGRDTRALRFESAQASFGTSSDTRRHEPLAELFRGVDLLLHDCGGLERDRESYAANHASAADAGAIASAAGVGELRLIHLSEAAERDEAELVAEARQCFAGAVATARDGDCYRLPRPRGGPV